MAELFLDREGAMETGPGMIKKSPGMIMEPKDPIST